MQFVKNRKIQVDLAIVGHENNCNADLPLCITPCVSFR